MKGFVRDIERIATENANFRQVLFTAEHCQLVVMSLKPGEDIGAEIHQLDQFFRVEEGNGEAVLDDARIPVRAGFAVLVPAGTKHNIINTGKTPLRLYTLYAPPNHRDGTIHATRSDADKDNETFDGRTTGEQTAEAGTSPRVETAASPRPRLSLRLSSSETATT